jgi:hypothetical protein
LQSSSEQSQPRNESAEDKQFEKTPPKKIKKASILRSSGTEVSLDKAEDKKSEEEEE